MDRLSHLFTRVNAIEGKWLVRILLKDTRPAVLNSSFALGCCHPLLPTVFRIREDLAVAVAYVEELRQQNKIRPSIADVWVDIGPQVGIKVGRQNWIQARGLQHCISQCKNNNMSVQAKIDGEYIQIHIDREAAPANRIKIFSKSGRDSTEDRQSLIP